jgi:hypothetical protein
MNERIRELERQAEKFVMGIPASLDINEYTSVFNEKFAELIVRECARIAFDESAHAGRMNKPGNCLFGTNIGRRIEKHFGVEE